MNAPPGFVVAIDGPAASGKSTTARLAAEHLGFLYLDTGAMYRALTWKALRDRVDLEDAEALTTMVDRTRLEIEYDGDGGIFLVDGENVTDRIREPRISRNVSRLAQAPGVRRAMVRMQREIADRGAVIVEGRDIGTVVFPGADVKIFLEASLDERARRRRRELQASGVEQPLEELAREIGARDEVDSRRADSPLRKADDAIPLDTTGLSIAGQVEEVVRVVREALARRTGRGA